MLLGSWVLIGGTFFYVLAALLYMYQGYPVAGGTYVCYAVANILFMLITQGFK
jgi:hypothetical protein